MSNTSTIHIKTDFDCKVYDYGQELGTTKADTYFNIELRKGEHELTFVFTGDDSISKTINYTIEDVDCDYRLVVKIVEIICDKAKEHSDSENYSVAFSLYSLAAEKSFPKALYELGVCYYYGNGVEKDLTKAVEWFTKAAEQGYVSAQYNLGYCYENGDGIDKSLTKAVEWYTKAANQGDADAQCNLGICYYNGNGVEKGLAKAVGWFTKAAEQGHTQAQYNLGCCYENGDGIDKSLTKAVEWYTKAANQGDADAQYNLGYCYDKGNGVEKNLSKAVEWYIKAAEQGNARAQCNLGVCYEYEEGIVKDTSKAVEWYTKAAEQGHTQAQCNLGICYYNGNGVEKDLAKAVGWFTKAAEQGHTQAQYNLGYCYNKGIGVEKNFAKAVEWFTKAAEQGHTQAQSNLGYCYDKGNGVEKNLAKAVEWYTKAAEQGNAQAQCNLGVCYEYGEGIVKDTSKAVEWFTKAAEQGDAQAQCNLGVCYEYGMSVEKNITKAIEWYTKATEQGDEDAKKALDRLKSIKIKPIHYLFFDTETAGLPKNYHALTHWLSNWPRLVQLSWITTDEDCNILSENDYIIYPDGFTIPEDAVRLHCITTEIAKEKGKPIKEVIDKFMEDFNAAKTIVGHNIDFDKKIIGAELIRLGQNDIMSSKEALCTMKGSVDYCKIPSSHGYKWPKLQELHKKLFGCEFEDAHNSMSDVKATLKCFKEMKEKGLYAGKYLVKSIRNFSDEEIAAVESSIIEGSQNGNSVCFHMVDGGQCYIPCYKQCTKGVGESIDLTKAKIVTLGKFGDDDILRVLE